MMEKHEILEVIKVNLTKVIDADFSTIDETQPMAAYGANSLDVVDVVSMTMRQLKIKVPRTELMNVKNMNDLANLFYEYNKAKEPVL